MNIATHEEVCDQALAHYRRISTKTGEWNSVVPEAIKFYQCAGNPSRGTKRDIPGESKRRKNWPACPRCNSENTNHWTGCRDKNGYKIRYRFCIDCGQRYKLRYDIESRKVILELLEKGVAQ